jgi:uncharacterized protein YqhQ
MTEFLAIVLIFAIFIGGPVVISSHESEKAVNRTTVECIETPDICKMRYEYMKLGDKLKNAELDKLMEEYQK